MSLFICEKCKTIENTALGSYWARDIKLCSECATGKWHGKFAKDKYNKLKHYLNESDFVEYIPMNKNEKLLKDFTEYCKANPELRFWQALRNWSGWAFIRVSMNDNSGEDTFYWENKDN